MPQSSDDHVWQAVREHYGKVATSTTAGCGEGPSCGGNTTSYCGGSPGSATAQDIALALGYTQGEVSAVPLGANMGLGCGHPQALAALRAGETVLDLGSGGGFDCLLAARQVGPAGYVIGVDMTPEMLSKARRNASEVGYANVEFRLGKIEHLPVADHSDRCHSVQLCAEPVPAESPGLRRGVSRPEARRPPSHR